MKFQRRRRQGAAIAAVTIVAALGAASSVQAGVQRTKYQSGFRAPVHVLTSVERTQIRLDRDAAILEHAAAGDSGFAGIRINPIVNSLNLYWHGTLPSALADFVAQMSRSTKIAVRPSRYTKSTLDRLRTKIFSTSLYRRYGIDVVSVPPTGAGLNIGVSRTIEMAKRMPVLRRMNVPLHFSYRPILPTLSSYTRQADKAPFSGGAWITNPTSSVACTSAFQAHFANDATKNFMLTAYHCFDLPNDNALWYAGTGNQLTPGEPLGEQWNGSTNYDTGTIGLGPSFGGTPNGGPEASIYVSGYNSTSIRTVKGDSSNTAGDIVYVGGAYSGEVGNNKIISNDTEWHFDEQGIPFVVDGSEATLQNGKGLGAIGPGDSGAPVYTYTTGGVSVRGINSAGAASSETTGCYGIQTECFGTWFFTNVKQLLPRLNLALTTA
jgi:hypothetical protein